MNTKLNKKMIIVIAIITTVFCLGIFLKGCTSKSKAENRPKTSLSHSSLPQKISLKRENSHKSLYFAGTIQALHESVVVSPMDAVIDKMPFHYGQMVSPGEVIFTLNSIELQHQYDETLTEYLKAKDNFTVTQAKFRGTEHLWDAGLIAKNNFLSEKSGLNTARMTLMQSTKKLTDMLEKMDASHTHTDLSKLNMAQFEKIRQVLSDKHNLIQVKAASAGILLYPPKSTSDDKSGQLNIGSAVKAGQALAVLGDLRGIRVDIDVPEIDIANIHPGMKAMITGVALGKVRLQGKLTDVNAQAFAGTSNALPSFKAVVEVKQLREEELAQVKVGMSASIELIVEEKATFSIPIGAITHENGQNWVTLEEADGKKRLKKITIGTTDVDTVIVESGLSDGDVLVIDKKKRG